MREIKFRAWDKEDKRMIVDEQDFIPLKVTNKGVFRLSLHYVENMWTIVENERFELMQFTGLTDRNGKDIYEGDILKICDDADDFITNGKVEWLYDFWNVSDVEDSLYGLTRNGYVEVMGNVYENKELLEV